jgi:argininosuccinate synthase
MATSDIKKVVLAYSGGLDTSIILKWLQTSETLSIAAICLRREHSHLSLRRRIARS